MKLGTAEVCCRAPTPSPTEAPNNNPTRPPISAPPSAPPGSKSSNCRLPPPQQTFTSMKDLADALRTRPAGGSLSLKVTLRIDETLRVMVNVSGIDVEIDGSGRTITLSDFGFHVDGGRLCLHDVELTGGRNVPALVVLGQNAEANLSHVRISDCATHTDLDEVYRDLISALDVCNYTKPAFDNIPSPVLRPVCRLLPAFAQQCCDPSKVLPSRADVRLLGTFGAGTAQPCACGRTHP